jgi:hypothetical protein
MNPEGTWLVWATQQQKERDTRNPKLSGKNGPRLRVRSDLNKQICGEEPG